MAKEGSLKDIGRGLLNFLPELIEPQVKGLYDAKKRGEDFEWDKNASNQTKRNMLKYLLDAGIEGVSSGKLGLSRGVGLEYKPSDKSSYYAEKRPGGFEVGGTINF